MTLVADKGRVGSGRRGERQMVMTDDTGFDAVFAEIRSTRARYEALRAAGGPLDERARMVSALHALRADLARLRPSVV